MDQGSRMDARTAAARLLRPGFGVRRGVRVATARARMLPTCVIIGAQKCGTTSLHLYLTEHPQIGESQTKEVRYFDQPDGAHTELWYRAHFPLKGRYRYAIESSPYYLFHPRAPERLSAAIPDAKLIALLRDPVARAYSHYNHARAHGRETLSFADAIEAEDSRLRGEHERLVNDPTADSRVHRRHSYVHRGLYARQIRLWYEHFDPDQLLIVESEALFEDPAGTLAGVQEWLGVPVHLPGDLRPQNTRSYDAIDAALAARLRDRFAADRAELEALTGMTFRWP
jgi:hypothetical protein